jgi:type I restriction-modification system DNA methylase subunit
VSAIKETDFQTPSYVCQFMVSLLPANVSIILEPTPGKGNLVRALAGYRVTAPANFWMVSGRFDAVIMNPPFTPMEQGYRILYAVMEMSDVVIALMPWLTLINSKRRTKDIKTFGLKDVIHLPRDVFSGSRVQTCILNMRKGYAGKTSLRFLSMPDGAE